MNYSRNIRNVPTKFLSIFAALAMMASPKAGACKWYDVPCKAEKAARAAQARAEQIWKESEAALAPLLAAAQKALEDAAKATEEAARKAAEEVAARAVQAAKEAAARAVEATAQASIAWNEVATSTEVSLSEADLSAIATLANRTYGMTYTAVEREYRSSLAAIEALYDAFLEAIFRETGKLFIQDNRDFLVSLQHNMDNLDAEGAAALRRIVLALSTKGIDDEALADMRTLGNKLGLVTDQANSIVPRSSQNGSFGVVISGGATYYAGAITSVACIINAFGDPEAALTASFGGSLGYKATGSISVGIVWSPSSVDNAGGPSVGFGAGFGPAGAELSWDVGLGMSGASKAIPSFTLSFGQGFGVDATFNAGHTLVLARY